MGIFASPISSTAAVNTVSTGQTTTSTSFTDLATAGPAVTINVGSSGIVLVCVTADCANNTAGDYAVMGYAVSGANTIAATSTTATYNRAASANQSIRATATSLLTGLTPGSTTFTAKYEVITGGTATFASREISVIPL